MALIGIGALLLFAGGTAYADVTPEVDIVEVTRSSGNYLVTTNGAEDYVGTSFTEAMQNAAGGGNRVINVRAGGITTEQVRLFANTTLNWLTESKWDSHLRQSGGREGAQIFAKGVPGIHIKGLRMTTTSRKGPGYGIRLSSCPGARIEDVSIDWQGRPVFVGIRVDNESNGGKTIDGLDIRNVEVRNTAEGSESHGVETMGVDNVKILDVTGVDLGGCLCLVQTGSGGWIGEITGTRCGWGTGYATMRFANEFSDCYVHRVTSDGKGVGGRGLFILNSEKITVNEANIRNQTHQDIYIQGGRNNIVQKGSANGKVLIGPRTGGSPGSRINVASVE